MSGQSQAPGHISSGLRAAPDSLRREILRVGSPEWAATLSRLRHDVYHLPDYVDFAARRQVSGEPLAFVAEQGGNLMMVPLIVRPVPPELLEDATPLFDATGPLGYPGPILALESGRESGDFVDQAVRAFGETLRENMIVAAFIRLHPLLTPSDSRLTSAGAVVEHGSSTAIDLSRSLEQLWSDTNRGHRSRINKARRLGYVARVDDEWTQFAGLVHLYQETMVRLDARPFWHLSADYFADLRASLGDRLFLLVVERDGELASAALFTEVDGIVEYHLSGSAQAFLRDSPSKLLIDFARGWARDRGNRILHLAGSLRPDDSLAQFKAGFSPLTFPVRSWRLITDPIAYGRIVDRWERLHEAAIDPPEGYFPGFRKTPVGAGSALPERDASPS